MKLKRESDLMKMIHAFGNLSIGKHKIHNTEILLTDIEVDYVEVIAPYGEAFTKEKYHMGPSNAYLKPIKTEVIDKEHREYSNVEAKYNNRF